MLSPTRVQCPRRSIVDLRADVVGGDPVSRVSTYAALGLFTLGCGAASEPPARRPSPAFETAAGDRPPPWDLEGVTVFRRGMSADELTTACRGVGGAPKPETVSDQPAVLCESPDLDLPFETRFVRLTTCPDRGLCHLALFAEVDDADDAWRARGFFLQRLGAPAKTANAGPSCKARGFAQHRFTDAWHLDEGGVMVSYTCREDHPEGPVRTDRPYLLLVVADDAKRVRR